MHSLRRAAWLRPWAAAALAFGVAIALGAGPPAGAAPAVEVYVYGKPLGETPMMRGQTILVPLEPLLKIQGLPYTVTGQTWNIVTGGAPPSPPTEPSAPAVIVNGSACTATATIQNRMYVEVYAFEALVGAKVIFNKETGILDILKPTSKVTAQNAEQAVKIAANLPPVLPSTLKASNLPGVKKLLAQLDYWTSQSVVSYNVFEEIFLTLKRTGDANYATAQNQWRYFQAIAVAESQFWTAVNQMWGAFGAGNPAGVDQSWSATAKIYNDIITWLAPASCQNWHESFSLHMKREVEAIGHMLDLIGQEVLAIDKGDQITAMAVDKLLGDLGDEFHDLGAEESSLSRGALHLVQKTAGAP